MQLNAVEAMLSCVASLLDCAATMPNITQQGQHRECSSGVASVALWV
jgi:hypothetical protein